MKKAILITGIIWAVSCLLAAIFEILFAITCFTGYQDAAVPEITIDPNPLLGVANFVAAAFLLAGAILAIVLIVKRNSEMKKVPGIVLGVIAAVFGATVPGVLFAIDSGMERKAE